MDQSYDRATRQRILSAQARVALFVRKNLGHQDPFDEELPFKRLEVLMVSMGYNKDEIDSQLIRLRSFYEFGPPAKKQKWVELREAPSLGDWDEGPDVEERAKSTEEVDSSVSSDEHVHSVPRCSQDPIGICGRAAEVLQHAARQKVAKSSYGCLPYRCQSGRREDCGARLGILCPT